MGKPHPWGPMAYVPASAEPLRGGWRDGVSAAAPVPSNFAEFELLSSPLMGMRTWTSRRDVLWVQVVAVALKKA